MPSIGSRRLRKGSTQKFGKKLGAQVAWYFIGKIGLFS